MHFPAGSQVLFVGEGDFSFITSLTRGNWCVGAHLTASALQDELSERAKGNVELLRGRGVEVVLGVDATCLHLHPLTQHRKFTHIVFNFPHVGGKMRIERNRKLLRDFFQSATQVLEVDGCVLVTLCGGQGGVTLDPTARRYGDSWKVVLMASHADMVLKSIKKFTPGHYPGYSATGYRSMEKGFCQASALTYTFQVSTLHPEPNDVLLTCPVSLCDGCVFHLSSSLHTRIERDMVSDSSSLAGYLFSLLLGVLGERLSVHRGEKLVFRKEGQEESLRRYCEKLLLREQSQEESVKNFETASNCVSLQELTIGGDTGLRDSHRVDCSEKLMSRSEVQEGSVKISETFSNCGSLQEPTGRSHSPRRVNIGGGDTGLRDSSRVDCSEKLMSRNEVQEESHNISDGVSKRAILPRAQTTVFCHSAYRINTEGSLSLDPLIILLCPGNTETTDHLLSQPQTIRIRNVNKSFVPETKSFTFRDFTEGKMCFTAGRDVGYTVTCYLISVVALAEQCGGVKEDEVWGEGQTVGMCDDALMYTPFSLFPSKYTYDLSFWETRLIGEESAAKVSDAAKDGNSFDSTGRSDKSELTVSELRGDNKTSLNTIERNYEAKPTLSTTNTTSHNPPTAHTTKPLIPPPFKTTLDTLITNIGGEALRNYKLIGVYECPKTARRSYTYRLVYRSWRGALSDEAAKRIHGDIGRQLEKCMGVEVR